MRHTPRPYSEELRAETIESGSDVLHRGLVGAILQMTRSDLEKLGQEYKEKEMSEISESAQVAEKILLTTFSQILPILSREHRDIEIELTLKMKEQLKEVLPAIQYLYTLRYGDMKGGDLNKLLNTNENEPFALTFTMNRDATGKFYIEKMKLTKTEQKKPE